MAADGVQRAQERVRDLHHRTEDQVKAKRLDLFFHSPWRASRKALRHVCRTQRPAIAISRQQRDDPKVVKGRVGSCKRLSSSTGVEAFKLSELDLAVDEPHLEIWTRICE